MGIRGGAVRECRGSIALEHDTVKRSFYYFLFIIGLHGILGTLIGYFIPLYFKDIGLTGVQTGLYFSVASIATILLSLPMGITTDQKSIAEILMFSFFLMSISYVGLIVSKSFLVFCSFAFIGSFGRRFYYTASSTMFFKLSGEDNRREAGVYQLFRFVAMGLGMILGGFIISSFSFRHAFVCASAGNLVLIALAYFLPRTETVAIKLVEYKKAVFTPQVLFLTFVFSLSSLHWGAEMVAYSPFLKEVIGLSIKQCGLYIGIGFLFVGFGAYLGMILLEKEWIKSLQVLLSVGFLLTGVFHILMCVHNVYWSFAFRIFHEIGDGLVFLVYYHGIAKVFHLDKIGGCAAFISLWMMISSMGSSIFFGYIRDTLGDQWPLIISGIILMLVPLLLLIRKRPVVES